MTAARNRAYCIIRICLREFLCAVAVERDTFGAVKEVHVLLRPAEPSLPQLPAAGSGWLPALHGGQEEGPVLLGQTAGR